MAPFGAYSDKGTNQHHPILIIIMRIIVSVFQTLLLLLILPGLGLGQGQWQNWTSVEDITTARPHLMHSLLNDLDLSRPGLERVHAAQKAGKLEQACTSLLDYYREGNHAGFLIKELPDSSDRRVAAGDTLLENIFEIQNVRGKLPIGSDGHRDWFYKGPNKDREWAWLSNRHTQLNQLLDIYFQTGNPIYVRYIDSFLKDFILKSLPYPSAKGEGSIWRGLEVAARAKVWSRVFYALLASKDFSDATRLLMLHSFSHHAHYNRNFHGGNNWLTMEISALATVATNFPEYKESESWLDYSVNAMVQSMKGQIYPDGVQTELTSHYHNVSLANFELFKDICLRAGKSLPDFYNQTLVDMYDYIARAIRPDGHRILNNDGDRGSDRELLLQAAEKYNQPEWAYLAANGSKGSRPVKGPSYFFPWAGQLISRSGYDAKAHWSFFDLGPWGSGHQHNDKLHLSIAAYGRDLLVDAGRFAYTGAVAEKFRPYARGSEGHNVLLIDGKGQGAGPLLAKEALSTSDYKVTEAYDFAVGSMDSFKGIKGTFTHHRALFYVRGEFWVVVDRLSTDRPRSVQALWHWHPDCKVSVQDGRIQTVNESGNLAVIPVGKMQGTPRLINGQETPELQGWYSPEYNVFGPNTAGSYESKINSDTTLVWVLLPFEKELPEVKTNIMEETAEGVLVKVNVGTQSWDLRIPFYGSKNAAIME
ncbi:alginate lyase family protein [Dyadobacter tibetensis]|uniref:alginate lyase family protein n=1 Tax=Dyadobacter tibetensis TaxID=1211851 RepID=UPI00047114FE|nr:alginate lyase family protein [Dyadobacter tibetensis]